MAGTKVPISVLVVIYTQDGQVLLLERADKPGFWQSVTGSIESEETLLSAAWRELFEETGFDASVGELLDWHQINRYEIYEHWRHRYPIGVTHNEEHVFGFCLKTEQTPKISPREHLQFKWLNWSDAATKVFSPSNQTALRDLGKRLAA